MAIPITMKALDELIEQGGMLQFIGVGTRGLRCEYWIAIALSTNPEDEAFVLVASNSSNIRTLRHKAAVESIVDRYPDKMYIQTMVLPLRASIGKPEDIYRLSRSEIEQLDAPQVISRRPAVPDS